MIGFDSSTPTLQLVLRKTLLFAVLGALALTLAASAHDGDSFVFEGAGWGHGVGMSQWGAYGQAREDPDKPGEEIAAHYYPGSAAGWISDLSLSNDLLDTLDHPIWVNLGSEVTLLEFTAVGGPLDLCLAGDGEGPCPKPEQPQEGERWEFRRIERNECGFFHSDELQGTPGRCRASISWPDAAGVRLRHGSDRNKPCAARSGDECEYRHGELKLRDDPDPEDIGFHVVLAVGLEDYLRGIAEIPGDWEAPGVNEAQAIAARSYAAFKFFQYESGPRPDDPDADPGISPARKDSCWCHLYDNTRDMQYVAWSKESRPEAGPWLEAVEATRGRVLTYFGPSWERYTEGGIVQAFFSASSGGITRSNRYGFFTERDGRNRSREWPYLKPVEDPWDIDPDFGNPHALWRRQVSASTIARLLEWEEVTDATLVVEESISSPAYVRFDGLDEGESISTTVAGAWLRGSLGLKSSNVVAIDGESPDPSPEIVHGETPTNGSQENPPGGCIGNDGIPLPDDECIPYDIIPRFEDEIGTVHADGIRALREASLTSGCGNGTRFCTDDVVTRGAMATFLLRVMRLEPVEGDSFSDVPTGHRHRGAIYAIAGLGITSGCGDGTRFCPDDPVTREVMAVFLARALELEPGEPVDGRVFTDVPDTHPQSNEIYAIAEEGITTGCGDGTRFCPDDPVTRGAMATFLARTFIWKAASPPG